ncbi:carotenoid oxygenase family protein, partial [Nonomuraea longicatena]
MTNPYLEGHFAPLTEEITAFDLPVTGSIPAELVGRYLRNGPNPLGVEDPAVHNWVLGDGMVHGVRLRDGRAEWYRNRWVRSSQVAAHFGEEYSGAQAPQFDFAANTHVIGHGGRTLALMESGAPVYELGYELDTKGVFDFDGDLSEGFTAHTKFDAAAQELHGVSYFPLWDHIKHVVIGSGGQVLRATEIAVPDAPMVHDFALTEKYVVIFDLPVIFSPEQAAGGATVPYVWKPEHESRVGLMPRDGGEVRWVPVAPCFVFHTFNAYDTPDGGVIVDVIAYDHFDVADPTKSGSPVLERWTVDPVAGKVSRQGLDERPQEFPRVNEALMSRPHRFGYTAAAHLYPLAADDVTPDEAFANVLIKHDLQRGSSEAHVFGRDAVVSEAVFAPSAAG